MIQSRRKRLGDLSFGLLLIAVAIFALVFAADIQRPRFADENDVGPRAFPSWLAISLLVGGVFEMAASVWRWRRRGLTQPQTPTSGTSSLGAEFSADEIPARQGRVQVAILAVAVCVYVVAISWLGFTFSTMIFSSGMMLRLGARWWLAILVTGLILIGVHVFFVGLFEVQLPEGPLDGRIPRIAW